MARTYGRVPIIAPANDVNSSRVGYGQYKWVVIETADGDDSYVWCETLAQCIQLNLNESPFFANLGVPARGSIIQQIAPDYAMAVIQAYFAKYFSSLTITRRTPSQIDSGPIYDVYVIRKNGSPHQFAASGVPR